MGVIDRSEVGIAPVLVKDDGEVIQELTVTAFTRIPKNVRHDGAAGQGTVDGDAVVEIEDNPATGDERGQGNRDRSHRYPTVPGVVTAIRRADRRSERKTDLPAQCRAEDPRAANAKVPTLMDGIVNLFLVPGSSRGSFPENV